MLRFDSQALEVAAFTSESGDRVPDQLRVEAAGDASGRGRVDRLEEVGAIELPERIERVGVDVEECSVLPPTRRSQPSS